MFFALSIASAFVEDFKKFRCGARASKKDGDNGQQSASHAFRFLTYMTTATSPSLPANGMRVLTNAIRFADVSLVFVNSLWPFQPLWLSVSPCVCLHFLLTSTDHRQMTALCSLVLLQFSSHREFFLATVAQCLQVAKLLFTL